MTAGEFRAWMDGFLIGKTTLTKKDVETIRAKSQEVYEVAYPYYPINPWWRDGPVVVPLVNPTWVTTCLSASASDRTPYVGAVQ